MMLFTNILLGISGFLIFLGGLGFLIELFEKSSNKPSSIQVHYQLSCTKAKLCRTIISWGLNNISPYCKNDAVNFSISYYRHKKLMGTFFSSTRQINIYINNHSDVKQIIDTALHEVVHYKQFRLNPRSFNSIYSKHLAEIGYKNHPMEIEARNVAALCTDRCLDYLILNGFVRK
jgi:hypothetical protein